MQQHATGIRQRGVDLRARTFSSLHVPNYRRYTQGQLISLIGTWMQSTAQALLVLRLTDSGTDLGVVIGLQTLPILLLGPYMGVLIDRLDKRTVMVFSQAIMGALSGLVAVLTLAGEIRIWMLFLTALTFGVANSIANPARQTFVLEMVGPKDLRNAITLNTVLVNAARAVGPAIAALLIVFVGIGWCFVGDALSYAVVIATLVSLDTAALHPTPPVARAKGQLREGFAYVARTPGLLVPLLMMTVVGMLTYEFQVSLPLMSQFTFHGDATTFGAMTASMGVGAVVGGLAAAGRQKRGPTLLARSALVFGVVVLAAAAAPVLWLEVLILAFVGGASVTFLSLGNATLQLQADSAMRGRVMGLWSVAFLGTTPIGSPLIGAVGEHIGPRYGLLIGGLAALLAGGVGYGYLRRLPSPTRAAADAAEVGASAEAAENPAESAAAGGAAAAAPGAVALAPGAAAAAAPGTAASAPGATASAPGAVASGPGAALQSPAPRIEVPVYPDTAPPARRTPAVSRR